MKTFEDIAPRTVPDRQTDRLTRVFIELLAAAKMHKAWMTCEALYRHYTKNSLSDCTIHIWDICMMTSSNGNIFRVTGHLCGEFTGHRWIPCTKAVTRSFDAFFDLRPNKQLSKQWWGWWSETPSCPLWRHRNGRAICASTRSLDARKNESLCEELCVRACDMQCAARIVFRADSRFAPRQWETALLCNGVSHWLGASLKSALMFILRYWLCSCTA